MRPVRPSPLWLLAALAACDAPPTDPPPARPESAQAPVPAAPPAVMSAAAAPAAEPADPFAEALPASAELRALFGGEPTPEQLVTALAGLADERAQVDPATERIVMDWTDVRERRVWRFGDASLLDRLQALEADVASSLLISKVVESFYRPRSINGRVDDRFDPTDLRDIAVEDPEVAEVVAAELAAAEAVGMLLRAPVADGGRLRLPAAPTLGKRRNLCPDQRFRDEPSLTGCSGVLVARDIVATANHCLDDPGADPMWFVFDYENDKNAAPGALVPAEDAYRVRKQLRRSVSDDWALLQLDRAVTGRAPAVIRERAPRYLTIDEYVFAAGHPDGLPLKVTRSGRVVDWHSDKTFENSLDTFHGNSGSPVFDRAEPDRRYMVGLVLRGREDYRKQGSCYVVAHCLPSEGCMPKERALAAYVISRALAEL